MIENKEEKIKEVEAFLKKERDKSYRKGLVTGLVAGMVIISLLLYFTGFSKMVPGLGQDMKMKGLQHLVEENYLFEDKIDKNAQKDATYKGYIESLGDPYSEYFTKTEYKSLEQNLKSEIFGVGIVFTTNYDKGESVPTVVNVIKGYSADKAGVEAGDIILAIDDEDISRMSQEQLGQAIRGPKNSQVKMTILKKSTGKTEELSMTRQEIVIDTVYPKVLDNNVGYIEIQKFAEGTATEFEKAVNGLLEKNVKGIVLDLRNNPGGMVDSCTEMLDYLLPKGTLVSIEKKDGTAETIESDADEVKIPISIIINEHSASASELFSGAMQDYGRAKIVGVTSFGKGIVQNIYPLKDGSAVKLTVAEYLTPKGRHIHKKGVKPDIKVEETRENLFDENDAQLRAAIKALGQS